MFASASLSQRQKLRPAKAVIKLQQANLKSWAGLRIHTDIASQWVHQWV
jgi:hypothetical protein